MGDNLKFDWLLIDGDVFAFIAAAAVQKNMQDALGNWRSFADPNEGELEVERLIARHREKLKKPGSRAADTIVLSDPDANWRWDVVRSYKDNRVTAYGELSHRPMLLGHLKDYLRQRYGAFHHSRLEADDTISIIATSENALGAKDGGFCIVGRDKDFKSIPGWLYTYKTDAPIHITLADADRWHYAQSLAGDVTDGFHGCPGIGIKRAQQILDEGCKFVPQEGILTKGPNKGQKTIKWFKEPCDDPWQIIVSCYERAGLSEDDALTNARLAHLLRHGEYNFTNHEVTLWLPPSFKEAN